MYHNLCCPDPCYDPRWWALADAAFFTSAARPVSQQRFRWDAGFEHPLRHGETYTNPSLPFGPDAREEVEGLVFHGSLSRAW